MAVDVQVIKDKREELKFEFQGDTVKGQCYPFRVTPAYLASLRKLAAKADAQPADGAKADGEEYVSKGDARMVAELIPEWDVIAGGKPWPPTAENIGNTPSALLGAAAYAILDLVGNLSAPSESKS